MPNEGFDDAWIGRDNFSSPLSSSENWGASKAQVSPFHGVLTSVPSRGLRGDGAVIGDCSHSTGGRFAVKAALIRRVDGHGTIRGPDTEHWTGTPMIVIQESDVRKSQPSPGPNVSVATSSTPLIPAESPPAYTPREDPGPSSSSVPPYHNPPPPPVTQKLRPKRAAHRFIHALLLALGAYAAIASVVKFLANVINGRLHDPRRMVGYPEPEDGTVIRCIRGRDNPWSPTARVQFPSFGIPLNSSAIYLLARGQQATGRVTVVPHPTSVSDEIIVDVVAQYHEWNIFMNTNVCLMERNEGERGVGIFVSTGLPDASYVLTSDKKTPKHLIWTNRRTEVEITVKIPHQPAAPALELSGFEILTPDFQVTLPNADKFVHFHNLTIHTSNMPVAVDSVKATNIDIQTSNVGIHGTFITDSSLSLTTSNAPIVANIMLENDHTSGKETSVRATTTSGSLTGAIALLSNMGAPRYTIRAFTTNAGLNLALLQHSHSHPSAPPILDIVGHTTNGPAELLLQSSFEGTFDVSTSPTYRAGFSSGSTPERDPLGLGRHQHIGFTTDTQSRKEGHVYWGDLDDGRELGRVELSTSNGPASLHIQ
ncbi:hypothetical protein BDM02DRAFT_3129549 [Thelephora ganbajun]|uniref:Uncharacterized protein n=1 Tax=Thelephora ganbajun TaxID=370292 RepID=A0ACB6ZE97_THEGA|nr:hypothetical protein BDM02DRAFT_3129549 [Thelephora ganbajun]